MSLAIDEVWVFVSKGDDADEGVMAYLDPITLTWLPMVCADRERVASLLTVAEEVADKTGIAYEIRHFVRDRT